MAKDPHRKFPIGTLVKVMIPTCSGPHEELLGIVIPIDRETTMSPSHFVAVYFSKSRHGLHVVNIPVGRVKSVSRPYVKEKT